MSSDRAPVPRGARQAPFGAGNRVGEVHGAHSAPRVAALAAEIEQGARADPAWPAYLDDAGYASAVTSWARAEAIVSLLWEWLAERDPTEALTSTLDSTTVTDGDGAGSSTSRTRTKRVASALDQLARWEAAASRQRQRLGLDPLSRARLGRDVAQTVDLASHLSALRENADRPAAGPEIAAVDPPTTRESEGT